VVQFYCFKGYALQAAIDWLFEQKPWNGVGDFDLSPMKRACSLFEHPQDTFKSIHVAGTNGKGSVVSYLKTILSEAGFSVGATISPHLNSVNERIEVNGQPISNLQLEAIIQEIREKTESIQIQLSFFECIVLAAFIHFAREKVDYAVIEVGLGGRLDATNVIRAPEASVITSIGLDHQHILGDTEEEIAREKAGIVRRGTPLFLGHIGCDVSLEATQVIEKVVEREKGSLFQIGREAELQLKGPEGTLFIEQEGYRVKPTLLGAHQIRNAALAASVMQYLGVEKKSIERGIARTFWPARLETLSLPDRKFLIDCAHNVAGFKTLASFLADDNFSGDMVGVVGFLKTKKWTQMIDIIDEYVSSYIIARPESPQAEDLNVIHSYLKTRSSVISVHDDSIDKLISRLLSDEFQGKNILLVGSIYLVAELRRCLFERVSV